jgi:hypothetical protein
VDVYEAIRRADVLERLGALCVLVMLHLSVAEDPLIETRLTATNVLVRELAGLGVPSSAC